MSARCGQILCGVKERQERVELDVRGLWVALLRPETCELHVTSLGLTAQEWKGLLLGSVRN